jgi:hypothetical protein
MSISGLLSCGPPARLTTHQPHPRGNGCKSDYQPAGFALTGWGSHPLDGSSKFQSTSNDFLLDRHCLVASSNGLLERRGSPILKRNYDVATRWGV